MLEFHEDEGGSRVGCERVKSQFIACLAKSKRDEPKEEWLASLQFGKGRNEGAQKVLWPDWAVTLLFGVEAHFTLSDHFQNDESKASVHWLVER